MRTYVLIPGAGNDPRVYEDTIAALADLGQEALAPPLPLDDDRAGPSDHADAVASALAELDPVVVVAQSLGAFTAPLVVTRAAVEQIVLVAPMIPKPRETAGEWWANTRHGDAIAGLVERFGPMADWGPEAIAEVFLHDVEPAVAERTARYAGEPGAGMFAEPWPLEAWPEVPTHVLAPRGDRLFPLEFQRRVAKERLGVDVDVIEGGHTPMLSRPIELAAKLVEVTD